MSAYSIACFPQFDSFFHDEAVSACKSEAVITSESIDFSVTNSSSGSQGEHTPGDVPRGARGLSSSSLPPALLIKGLSRSINSMNATLSESRESGDDFQTKRLRLMAVRPVVDNRNARTSAPSSSVCTVLPCCEHPFHGVRPPD